LHLKDGISVYVIHVNKSMVGGVISLNSANRILKTSIVEKLVVQSNDILVEGDSKAFDVKEGLLELLTKT
jgi:hypothetical protein